METVDEKVTSKGKPGRPRKNKASTNIPKLGIVSMPTKPSYCLECTIPNPINFKKMSSLFVASNMYDILFIEFNKDNFVMKFKDGSGTTRGRIQYNAKKLIRYYVEQPFKLKIKTSNFKTVSKITKDNYSSLSFIVDNNIKQKLQMILHHPDTDATGITNNNSIDTIYTNDIPFPSDEEYKLGAQYDYGFRISSKHIKNIVSEKKFIENNLTIEYIADGGQTKCNIFTKGNKGAIASDFSIAPENIEYFRDRREVEKKKVIGISVHLSSLRKVPSALSFKDEDTKKDVSMVFRISDELPLHITSIIGDNDIRFDFVVNTIDFSKLSGAEVLGNTAPVISSSSEIPDTKSTHYTAKPKLPPTTSDVDIDSMIQDFKSGLENVTATPTPKAPEPAANSATNAAANKNQKSNLDSFLSMVG
jgi:hypothetical protein